MIQVREERAMLDHVGIPVADFMRSKAFYLKCWLRSAMVSAGGRFARRPAARHAGFGAKGKPQFWIGSGKPIKGRLHVAFVAKDPGCGAGLSRGCARGGRQGQWGARPAAALSRELLRGVCSRSRTATISRRSAILPSRAGAKIEGRRRVSRSPASNKQSERRYRKVWSAALP